MFTFNYMVPLMFSGFRAAIPQAASLIVRRTVPAVCLARKFSIGAVSPFASSTTVTSAFATGAESAESDTTTDTLASAVNENRTLLMLDQWTEVKFGFALFLTVARRKGPATLAICLCPSRCCCLVKFIVFIFCFFI